MIIEDPKKQLKINCFFILIALTIIYDYSVKGKTYYDNVISKKIEKDIENPYDRTYNSKNNSRYSYQIIMNKYSFYCSRGFLYSIKEGGQIAYILSPIFNEINNYKAVKTQKTENNTFRKLYGFNIPFIILTVFILSFWFENYIYVLTFIGRVFILVDLIYVLF
ncbi:hypothetical protein [Tenacibaculum agarivorans]|uniref:hypothetical protein n=1 Tax=Tenacibaculum agarivorans TaxID=1908389 RepID=UPI00094BB3BB|nr:hypothetical protein [Tenacibaculum agarivorans]